MEEASWPAKPPTCWRRTSTSTCRRLCWSTSSTVEAERVGAGQHEERDGQQQYQGKFTWRQNILLVALEWVQLISFSGHLEWQLFLCCRDHLLVLYLQEPWSVSWLAKNSLIEQFDILVLLLVFCLCSLHVAYIRASSHFWCEDWEENIHF